MPNIVKYLYFLINNELKRKLLYSLCLVYDVIDLTKLEHLFYISSFLKTARNVSIKKYFIVINPRTFGGGKK